MGPFKNMQSCARPRCVGVVNFPPDCLLLELGMLGSSEIHAVPVAQWPACPARCAETHRGYGVSIKAVGAGIENQWAGDGKALLDL